MGIGNLTTRSAAQPVDETWWNTIQDAIKETFVGRNSSGVPTSGYDLGSSTYPWGRLYADELVVAGSLVDLEAVTNLSPYKILSGKVRTTSNQPAFLTPAGSGGGRSLTINGSVTNLVYQISDVTTTLAANITVSALTAAPSSNNTALINIAAAAGQNQYRSMGGTQADLWYGSGTTLTIDNAGSEITALIGKRVCLKLTHSAVDEYFTCIVESATTLRDCYRGFFYDSALAPINAVTISDNDVLTLMKLGWLFLDVDGTTTDAVYNEPIYSGTQPSGPASGDYWYDLSASQWKRYNGSSYASVDRILVGMFFCNTTDCLGVRCMDFFATFKPDNTIRLGSPTNTTVFTSVVPAQVSVMGNLIEFRNVQTWDITTHLATSADMSDATEQASRTYFMFVTDTGALKISDIAPYWRGDLQGYYHPHNPWRAVGAAYNNGSSNLSELDYGYYASLDRREVKLNKYSLYDDAVVTSKILNLAVTNAKLASHNYDYVNIDNTNTTTSATFQSLASRDITTVGRMVVVIVCPKGDGGGSYFQIDGVSTAIMEINLKREGSVITTWHLKNNTTTTIRFPSNLVFYDVGVVGASDTYTYALEYRSQDGSTAVTIENVVFIVQEI